MSEGTAAPQPPHDDDHGHRHDHEHNHDHDTLHPVEHNIENNKWVYIGGLAVVVILAIIFLVTYTQHKNSQEAATKAQNLQTKMVAAGYPLPDKDTVISLFGTSGGAVCEDPTGALSKAQWLNNMANGAGGPGMRPVIADLRVVAAEEIVISVYCPEHLAAFQDNVQDLKTGTTVRH
jgi:hypothetical protein